MKKFEITYENYKHEAITASVYAKSRKGALNKFEEQLILGGENPSMLPKIISVQPVK